MALRTWDQAAEAGHTAVLNWALAHGHPFQLLPHQALLSARHADPSVVEWWIATQPSRETAMAALSSTDALCSATSQGAINSLDWWWEITGSSLPSPADMKEIGNAALYSDSPEVVVEWWWMRFLEHRTPDHTFGGVPKLNEFQNLDNLDCSRDTGHFAMASGEMHRAQGPEIETSPMQPRWMLWM
ncbi:hypothetical protein BC828DRAFT_410197 [Blastocladiella britannica]|nr:hypothetical protein BC828DRAFT_410197 [Blastocladiella britannica]